jgi:hypothetical protein
MNKNIRLLCSFLDTMLVFAKMPDTVAFSIKCAKEWHTHLHWTLQQPHLQQRVPLILPVLWTTLQLLVNWPSWDSFWEAIYKYCGVQTSNFFEKIVDSLVKIYLFQRIWIFLLIFSWKTQFQVLRLVFPSLCSSLCYWSCWISLWWVYLFFEYTFIQVDW